MKPDVHNSQATEFIARIGQRVRSARQQQKISRRVLSEKSGVSQRYLAQLETGTGNISVALLFEVAIALGHKPEWLVSETILENSELAHLEQLFLKASSQQRSRAIAELSSTTPSPNKGDRVCLIGLRGAGKSTLGALLAEKLGTEFLELNTVVEEQSGMAVGEVMALYGQEGYRQLENQALQSIFETRQSVVVAAGGGIVSEADTYRQLLLKFHTIWLKTSAEEHMERVRRQGDIRPMAGNPKAMDDLRSILTSREEEYSRADQMIDTSMQSVDESLQDLIEALAVIHQR